MIRLDHSAPRSIPIVFRMMGGNNINNIGGNNEDEDEDLDGVTRMGTSEIHAKYKSFITS